MGLSTIHQKIFAAILAVVALMCLLSIYTASLTEQAMKQEIEKTAEVHSFSNLWSVT